MTDAPATSMPACTSIDAGYLNVASKMGQEFPSNACGGTRRREAKQPVQAAMWHSALPHTVPGWKLSRKLKIGKAEAALPLSRIISGQDGG